MMKVERQIWALMVAVGILAAFPAELRAESRRGVTVRSTPVHTEASDSSPVLGTYPSGSAVSVTFPSEDGWFQVNFSRPWKGKTSAFVREENLRISGGAGSRSTKTSRPARSESGDRGMTDTKGWLELHYGYQSSSPSAYQTQMGEVPASLSYPVYGLQAGFSFSPVFKGAVRISKMSFSKALAKAGATGTYSTSSLLGELEGYFVLVSQRVFSVMAGGGLGAASSSVKNESTGGTVETANIVTPSFAGRLVFRFNFGGVGLDAGLGYRILKLSAVPTLVLGENVPVDVALSGLTYGAGLFILF